MFTDDILDLRNHMAFSAYTDAELSELAGLGHTEDCMPGQFICREGEQADAFFILCSGSAQVVRGIDGRREVLGEIAPGKIFGQMALLKRSGRIASIVAMEPSVLLTVRRDAYFKLQRSDSSLAVRLHIHTTISAIRQLRHATRQLMLVLIRSEAAPDSASLSVEKTRRELVTLQVALNDWGLGVAELPEPNVRLGQRPMSERERRFRTTGRL